MSSKKKQRTNSPETNYPWLKHYPEMIDWHTVIEAKPLYSILDDAVKKYPTKCCLDFMGKQISYQQIGDLVDRATKGLQQIGVKKGTKVGIFLPNCPQFVVFYFAILKAGGIVVNFNPLYSFHEIKHQAEDSGITVMVTLDLKELFSKVKNLLSSTTLEKIVVTKLQDYLSFPKNIIFSLLKKSETSSILFSSNIVSMEEMLDNDGRYSELPIDPDKDIALLQYTGGTTGIPKAAMLSHANVHANTLQCGLWFTGMEDGGEVFMGALPFFHVFAMTAVMNLGIYKGAKIILQPRFVLKNVLKDIHKKNVTIMAGVPTMFNAINHSSLARRYSLKSLKACISGGAALPADIKESFENLCDASLVEGYGLTEAAPVACVNPLKVHNVDIEPVEAKEGTIAIAPIGLPLPATVVSIRDKENTAEEMPMGEIGELCITGPQVMMGYYNKPEETKLVLVDGWLRTGDLGYQDKNGYSYIVDRSKDVIITGGYNVFPRQVEEAIYRHPQVEEVAVLGVPDTHRGQKIAAFVVLRKGQALESAKLKLFLKDYLAAFEIPRKVVFRESLPKTMIGKISKKDIVIDDDKVAT